MSDTPETDAAEMPIDRVDTIASRPCYVLTAEFARKLERERDEAMEQNAKLRDIAERAISYGERYHNRSCDAISYGGGCDCDCGIEALRDELDQLKEGKK